MFSGELFFYSHHCPGVHYGSPDGIQPRVVANLGPLKRYSCGSYGRKRLAVTLTRRLLRMDRYGQLLSETDRDQPAADNIKNLEIAGDEPTDPRTATARKDRYDSCICCLGIIFGYLFIPLLFHYSAFETLSKRSVVGLVSCFSSGWIWDCPALSSTALKAGLRFLLFHSRCPGNLAAAFLCGLVLPLSQKKPAIGAGFDGISGPHHHHRTRLCNTEPSPSCTI